MTTSLLPPGQRLRDNFPRFGLTPFAKRFPTSPHDVAITIRLHDQSVIVSDLFALLPRVDVLADFHCVTTWSVVAQTWSGVRFRDFYEQILLANLLPQQHVTHVLFRAQDGYRGAIFLEDLLDDNVLIADRLNGAPLSIEHGAPLRLITPRLYGYKSIKHIKSIELLFNLQGYRPPGFRFMEHPRARVALEERGRYFSGWFLRYLYRPLITPTISVFANAMTHYRLTTTLSETTHKRNILKD
jgi:hypothetical protein